MPLLIALTIACAALLSLLVLLYLSSHSGRLRRIEAGIGRIETGVKAVNELCLSEDRVEELVAKYHREKNLNANTNN